MVESEGEPTGASVRGSLWGAEKSADFRCKRILVLGIEGLVPVESLVRVVLSFKMKIGACPERNGWVWLGPPIFGSPRLKPIF